LKIISKPFAFALRPVLRYRRVCPEVPKDIEGRAVEVIVNVPLLIFGIGLIIIVLWDSFETVVLPRRVTRRFRLARMFFRGTWRLWSSMVGWDISGKRQETLRSFYGPLSFLLLLSVWAAGLVVGFALVQWGAGAAIKTPEGSFGFGTYLYLSGTTFFTLGLGDVTPLTQLARALTVVEAGIGFGFLAIIIGYLPGLNQSFSRREVNISLLDARAGSPPTAAEMLRRHSHDHGMEALRQLFADWERWSAELLESHLSYPILAYFRSQHENQSWLGALTAILDASALVMVGLEGACGRQAELTFAIARHALVDLALVFRSPPRDPAIDRLPPEDLAFLRSTLREAGLHLRDGPEADRKLDELRQMYEPYVYSLSTYLRLTLPPWIPDPSSQDNWATSAWKRAPNMRRTGLSVRVQGGHF
jgi:hypothetical protein